MRHISNMSPHNNRNEDHAVSLLEQDAKANCIIGQDSEAALKHSASSIVLPVFGSYLTTEIAICF